MKDTTGLGNGILYSYYIIKVRHGENEIINKPEFQRLLRQQLNDKKVYDAKIVNVWLVK